MSYIGQLIADDVDDIDVKTKLIRISPTQFICNFSYRYFPVSFYFAKPQEDNTSHRLAFSAVRNWIETQRNRQRGRKRESAKCSKMQCRGFAARWLRSPVIPYLLVFLKIFYGRSKNNIFRMDL